MSRKIRTGCDTFGGPGAAGLPESPQMPDPPAADLGGVADALGRLDLSLGGDGAERARAEAERLVTGYLIPRLRDPDGNIVVAVVGVSGSGKSTLVNSLARRRVTEEGARRPTTIEPVAWSAGDFPATLDAVRRRMPGKLVETLRPAAPGITIVDTPPPGMRSPAGVRMAHEVVEVADACVVVASANRYADAAGFELARLASDRGIPVVFVMNRLPPTPEIEETLISDYVTKLAAAGLVPSAGAEAVISINEGPVVGERGALPSDWVTGLRKEVERLADSQVRSEVISSGVSRGTARLRALLATIRDEVIAAESRRVQLRDPVIMAYRSEAAALGEAVREGGFADAGEDAGTLVEALTSAAARRAGRAALRSAEHWYEVGGAPGARLFGHSADTITVAEERLRFWVEEIPRIAAGIGPAVSGRRMRRLTAAVVAGAVDPARSPVRRERRVLRRFPGLVDAARDRLVDELESILAADASRFLDRLGGGAPSAVLGRLQLDVSE
jgi:hypothetical protein